MSALPCATRTGFPTVVSLVDQETGLGVSDFVHNVTHTTSTGSDSETYLFDFQDSVNLSNSFSSYDDVKISNHRLSVECYLKVEYQVYDLPIPPSFLLARAEGDASCSLDVELILEDTTVLDVFTWEENNNISTYADDDVNNGFGDPDRYNVLGYVGYNLALSGVDRYKLSSLSSKIHPVSSLNSPIKQLKYNFNWSWGSFNAINGFTGVDVVGVTAYARIQNIQPYGIVAMPVLPYETPV
jgi:hypothetical protein